MSRIFKSPSPYLLLLVMMCGICGTYCVLPGGYGEGVCVCVVTFGATTHHRHVCTVCPDGRIQGIVPLNLIELNDDHTSMLHGPGKREIGRASCRERV